MLKKLCVTESDFPEKVFCLKNLENGSKIVFGHFVLIEKFGH